MGHEHEIHWETDAKKPIFALVLVLGAALLIGYGFIQQILIGVPFGNNPAPDWLMYVLLALFGLGLPAFILSLKLQVTVTDQAVHIKLFPIRTRTVSLDEIESLEAMAYRPLREYGGWGLRHSFRGTAYTMRGNRGVKLELKDGTTLMIGSHEPERLAQVISRARGTAV